MVCETNNKSLKICRCACRWRCKCVLIRDRKPHPPFNIGLKSRVQLDLNPKLYQHESPPIGSYDPPPIRKKCFVTSWKRKEEMEEFSATQGGRLLSRFGILEKEEKSNIGPGTYQLEQWPENIFEKRGKNVKKDIGFGTMSRFPNKPKFSTPGPGYTGRDHNPFFYIDQNRLKGFSSTPSFEYDGLVPRTEKEKTCSLPPNRYRVQHPDCINNVLKKVTGKRGPYDLFTAPRDNSTITGYFATTKIFDYSDWPKKIPGETDKLSDKSNYFKGVWSDCPRYPKKPTLRLMQNDLSLCYKDPSQPGPGQYDPKFPERPKNAKNYPFGISLEKERSLRSKEIRPGPGRYNPKIAKNIKGSGWTSVFRSKVPRTQNLAKEAYNDF